MKVFAIFITAYILVAVLTGCGGNQTKATTSTQTEAISTTKQSTEVKETLEKHMFENFGGGGNEKFKTSWYDSIKDYDIIIYGTDVSVLVKTSLYPKEENKQIAKNIMGAVMSWGKSKDSGITLHNVKVYAANNSLLVSNN